MFIKERAMAWLVIPGLVLGGVTTDVWSAQDPPAQKPTISGTAETTPSVLYGVVRSAKDQKSLAGVPIRIENTSSGEIISKTTDQQGAFIFSDLPPGDYKVRVGGGMFSVQQKEGRLKGGTVGEMDFAVNPLSQGTSEIVGSIFEGHGDNKIPLSARIAVENVKTKEVYQVNSDKTGIFSLKNIPSGNYIVQATKQGYLPYSQEIAVNGKTSEEIRLRINRLARANIQALGDKKIRNTTGAISIVDQKKFQQNLTTGATYTLMQNTPGIEFYSRSGNQGLTGGMNYMSCRGYTVGGGNTNPNGNSGIEMSVEGVPMNVEADGGEVYDLGIMNTDIKSASVLRGVTTSRETGNYAAGCSVNFKLVDPSQDPFQTINSGGGSYGLYYTSYVNNSGINATTNIGGYNDFTIIHNDGFQQFTNLTEYQYYGNLTKYLTGGRLYFIATANYKSYDRGASMSLSNFNTYGPTNNGGPSYSNPTNPGDTPNSPYFKNWEYGRFMLDLGVNDQITPSIRIKNSLFANVEPYGNTNMPAGFGSCNGISCTSNQFAPGSTFQNISPNMSGQLGYQFLQNYYQAEGYKAGDIAEVKYNLFKNDNLFLGMKGQYATYHYYIDPLQSDNIVGGTADAIYSQTTITGYLEDHWRPVNEVLFNVGFRVASVAQYFNDQVPGNYTGGGAGVSNGGSMLIPMPHVGLNYYPSDNWKLYVTGGESFAPPAIFDYKGFAPGALVGGVQPENVWDLSIGARYSTKKGYVALDAYTDYLTNMPVAVPFTSGTSVYNQYENIGQARQQGIEAEGKIDLGLGFTGSANFTYMNNVLGNTPASGLNGQTFAGDMIPFVPLDMGNLAVSYDHGPYHITVDERYTGMMNVIDLSGTPGNPMANVPGYFVTDLYASYDLPKVHGWYKAANLYVSAYNLLNTNYYNPAGYYGSGNTSTANNLATLFVYPGEPVNIFAGAKFTF
ncbi:MAG: TonB-dependent receptor [Nitrospirae bacterium]|nr:TonB-dependent receptor [Nitrospirota bacterium]MCL5285875.1 TonB-dependent receptor [Nitrospirota bacterium]